MREKYESLPNLEVYSKTLFNGKKVKCLASNTAEFLNYVQTYFQDKYALSEPESRALLIASDYKAMERFKGKTPEEWKELAEAGSLKIKWEEVPERLDENLIPFAKKS